MRPRSMAALLVLAACSVRPDSEQDERDRAVRAGAAFLEPFATRELPTLSESAALADHVRFAVRANGTLEAAWHRWIAALERVPQASTQATTAMVGAQHVLDGGDALDRTVFQLATDAMNNLVWPGRLGSQGEAALARARVAAANFDRERLRLVAEVTDAYVRLALRDQELVRIDRLLAVLGTDLPSVRARVRAGAAAQGDLLDAEVALARAAADRARLLEGRAALVEALRAKVGAGPEPADFRPRLLPIDPLRDDEVAGLEARIAANPDLALRQREVVAARASIDVREWERVPGFSLSGAISGDAVTTLGGMLSLPFLRGTAVEASIREAEAELRAAEALRRQAGRDATALVLAEVATLRAIEAEAAVLERDLLPRVQQTARVARAAWGAGRGVLTAWARALAKSLEIELAMLRLQAGHATARARLREALGLSAAGVITPSPMME